VHKRRPQSGKEVVQCGQGARVFSDADVRTFEFFEMYGVPVKNRKSIIFYELETGNLKGVLNPNFRPFSFELKIRFF